MKPVRSNREIFGDFNKATLHSRRSVSRWGTLLISFSSLCLAGKSLANPFGEHLKLGSAEFVRDGANLLIRQGSETLIVDWKDFSIGDGELTQFLQPGSSSAALNRVYDGNPSSIYGSLRANGKVYLINPNGVFIGPSGRVDAGSFVASTLDTSDEEFLKGGNLTFKGDSEASVVNFGTITALDGDAYLIARTIENHGTINAPKGTAGLAGGTEVILQPAGEEKIGVSITSGSGKVVNHGTIAAAQAELKAAGGNLYALAIKNTGTVRATGVERKGGRVFLRASGGTIENTGTIRAKNFNGAGGRIVMGPAKSPVKVPKQASGVRVVNTGVLDAAGSKGGSVTISADEVSLSESSLVSVTGTEDVGGGVQITANDILVSGTANLNADGFSGGGTIVTVAENKMEFFGAISARAGSGTGSGGFAEVSGLNSLLFTGTADLRAASGRAGTLLLDPANFTINTATAATIVNNLSMGNVVISTVGSGSSPGDIFVNAPVLYSSANNLSLLAHRNIRANANIQNGGTGALNLIAGWDGSTGLGPLGVDFNAFITLPSSFGNNAGSIFIGSDVQSTALSVGSRFGATNAAGFSMSVRGSDKDNNAFAQLGYHAGTGVSGFNINGPIQVVLKDDLTLTGGRFNFAYAQIGHGGGSSSGNFQGTISVKLLGDLRILGGSNFSYAQIGHGGDGSSGAQSGDIIVNANTLNLTGGSLPHANAQIGHGDASGDASGSRSGLIDIQASSETTLINGPGNNAIWLIGHGTKSPAGVSNADVHFSTGALDYSSTAVASLTTLNQDFSDKFSRNLLGGNVTIRDSGSGGLVADGKFAYGSPNSLTLISDTSATINRSIINSGLGEITVVTDNENANRPNLSSAASLSIAPATLLQSNGAIRIFAVSPANTHLGGFTPSQRRYNVWYGDAVTAVGVNFKFQPTLTLTIQSFTKSYGQTITFNGTEFTASGLQPGDSLTQVLAGSLGLSSPGSVATAGVTGSPYPIVFESGLVADLGYGLQLVPGALTITPAPLILTALNQSKIYGTALNFAGTEFSVTGLKNGESVGLVSLASAGGAAGAGVSGNPYGISIANARAGTFNPANYAISYVSGALTINQAPLTITASNQSKIYGDAFSFNGTAFTSVGLVNGDIVSSASLTSTGTALTAGVAASPYTINISNAFGTGLQNYAITYVPGAFTVTPAPLTLTALNQAKIYGSTLNFTGTEFSATGLKNGENVGLVSLASGGAVATAGVAGSPYGISIANAHGGTFNSANYAISYVPGALTINQAALTITASNQGKVYGNGFTFNSTAFTSVGLVNGDTVSSASLTSAGTATTAGVTGSPYAINISNAIGTDLQNYAITYVPGAFTVTPAPLTLTALNQAKVYGSTVTFTSTEFSGTGLKNGETVGLVDLASGGAVATASVAGSPYSITITNAHGGTFNPANYAISYVPGTLTVNQAVLTITASNQSKVYGDAFSFNGTAFTSAGLVNGDVVSSANLTSTGTALTAGVTGSPYAINISNAIGTGLQNYAITYVPGAFTVTPASLTLTALNQAKVYGSTLTFTGTEFSSTGLKNGENVGLVDLASTGAVATAGVAGSPYSITIANTHGGTFNPTNYAISYVPGALTVNQAALTITASNQSKVYGEAFSFNGTAFTSAGLVNGDVVSSANLTSTGTALTAGVTGSPYAINISNAIGTGLQNYAITYVPGGLTVTPAPLTLTALNQAKVYGSTLTFTGTEFSSAGLKNGENVGLVDLSSGGTVATAGVAGSPYPITIANAHGGTFNPANYAISYVPGALTVNQAALTITASNQSKVYGNSFVFSGTEFTSVGLRNSDTIAGATLASPGAPAIAGVSASPYTISISNAIGTGLNNYAITYVPGKLTVTPAALTITATNQGKIYGDALALGGTAFTSAGLVNGDTVSSTSLTSAGTALTAGATGSPYAINISNAIGTGLQNYAITYIPGALTVTPAPLTLTALNQAKVYGSTVTFTGTEFSTTGLKNGENVGLVDLASVGTGATAGVAGSPYSISISNAHGGTFNSANYAISYVPGALTVNQATLTITASNQSKVYGDALALNGTAFTSAGLVNGDVVSSANLTSAGTAFTAGVTGSPYAISISDAVGTGLQNYAITYVPGALTVTPAPITLTALNQSKIYGSTLNFIGTEFSAAGLKNGETVGLVDLGSTGAIATSSVAGSPYGISIANAHGGTFNSTNYAISYVPGALTINQAALTITASNQSKIYGDALVLNGTAFTSVGLVNSDTVSSASLTSAGTALTAGVAGSPYAINISDAIGNGLQNYAITYIPGALTVTPAPLTITALNQSKVYGSTVTFTGIEFSSTGLKNGENVGLVDLASTGAGATAGVAGGPYAITIANAHGGTFNPTNYAISYVPGALTINQAALTITATNQSKIYGVSSGSSGIEFTSAGLLNGDIVSNVNLTSAGAAAVAGVVGSPYAINIGDAGGTGLENYAITYIPGALTVTPAALTITASNQSKIYGDALALNGTAFTSAGLVNGDTVSSASLTSAGTALTAGVAGSPYTINISDAIGNGLQNYAITYIPGALTVTPAPLTLTALNQSKVYGSTLTFTGTEFSSTGLKNGENVGLVDLTSGGTIATAGVAGGPYDIIISNAHGGTFDPVNYAISFANSTLAVTPATLIITALDQHKRAGNDFAFVGTEFKASGLQNGETITLVALSSPGAASTAAVGSYAIHAADASGGTFDPTNYAVSYQEGAFEVLPKPVPPPPPPPPTQEPPPVVPTLPIDEVQHLISVIQQGNETTPQNATDPGSEGPSIISGFGIQRQNPNAFFGEQLLEPGGALTIDATGLGPPLPIGEAPQDLEDQLAEKPHEALEEAIAEDDKKAGRQKTTRYYNISPGELFKTNEPGEAGFEALASGPAALRKATEEGIEARLFQAVTQ